MVFTFHESAGEVRLEIKGEIFKYLIKVRRHTVGDTIALRQQKNPDILYEYQVESIDGRHALLTLQKSRHYSVKASHKLHLAWCLIDTKSIEKVLPLLNENGLSQITFITCKRSQKNFKLDFERFRRILETSSQQCGRSDMMEFATCSSVEEFLQKYPDSAIFDFGGKVFDNNSTIKTFLVGCEGGFSEEERQFFATNNLFSFNTPMILRSESAVVAISNIVLL